MLSRRSLLTLAFLAVCPLFGADAPVPPAAKPALDHISPRSLNGHLTFLASDLLEGRDTPSRGLDIAAEYIAAQFRRAGLEPAANGSYFQVAQFVQDEADLTDFQLSIKSGETSTPVKVEDVALQPGAAVALTDAPILKVNSAEEAAKLKQADVQNKVVVIRFQRGQGAERRSFNRLVRSLQALRPAALLMLDNGPAPRAAVRVPVLREAAGQPGAPYLIVRTPGLQKLLAGTEPATVSIHIRAAKQTHVPLRNVAGILRGSDPELKDTYLLVTAHYDHVGLASSGEDRVFNGANDDASGTVSVIEIAEALANLPQHPKRSILFMSYFGEEKGLLGSRYFGAHPLVPLDKIVGDLNLEQLGRTDSPEGSHAGLLQVTGKAFSDVTNTLAEAGKLTGVRLDEHDTNSDDFFSRSDNQALADQGIPAHTVCVAYEFPDYHKVGDSADKIDYDNMARIDRTVALAIWMMSENPQPPHWNEANTKTVKYVEAYRKLHPLPTAAGATSPGQE